MRSAIEGFEQLQGLTLAERGEADIGQHGDGDVPMGIAEDESAAATEQNRWNQFGRSRRRRLCWPRLHWGAMCAVSDLKQLLLSMEPVRHTGIYVFATGALETTIDPARVVASIREVEGLSVVMARDDALKAGLRPVFECSWISLGVHSDLSAVGLTAAVSRALADAGIACNVVAGTHHDHLFVPADRADDAMGVLRAVQRGAA